ncbi:DUF4148 domain-containing protein [Herbaspirillum sp. GCM10030257]|uniref:DUF4148 domain-containing protein n=1 Tax=Herbaspirillum sp. GCM10030257 TaxID=3273393 RepID=UPI0036192C15
MKSKKLAFGIVSLVLSVGASTGALADNKWVGNSGSNWLEHVQSTKTRAEVIAELEQARKNGLVTVGEEPGYPRQPTFKSGKTRAEVQAEAARASREWRAGIESTYFGG